MAQSKTAFNPVPADTKKAFVASVSAVNDKMQAAFDEAATERDQPDVDDHRGQHQA
jgi:hypothetical protein